MISSDEQYTLVSQIEMHIESMQQAIADLMVFGGEQYGYAVVYRRRERLEDAYRELGELLTLLKAGNLRKVS